MRSYSRCGSAFRFLAPAVPSGEAISKQDRDAVVKYLTATREQVIAEAEKLFDAQCLGARSTVRLKPDTTYAEPRTSNPRTGTRNRNPEPPG